MTIAEAREKCKSFITRVPRDVLIVLILILVALCSFGLGYLAGLDAGQGDGLSVKVPPLVATSPDERVLASRSGTKYYFPWCVGANRITDANKVWFISPAAASNAGYAPAANCSGPQSASM